VIAVASDCGRPSTVASNGDERR